MTTQRPRNKRLETVTESNAVRRSPRLIGRFTSHRQDGASVHRTAFISTVSSRPSLRSYGRNKKSERETSILNESGQSVPASFDEDDNTGKRTGMPHHLFGLDQSDNESTTSSMFDEHAAEPVREYEHIETTRVLTPRRDPQRSPSRPSFLSSLLYKCGSLIYLAATGVLCLDVIILHRLFNYGRPSQQSRSCGGFLFLLFLLSAVVLFLIGGGLITPDGDSPPPPPGCDSTCMTGVLKLVDNRVQNKLHEFNSSFVPAINAIMSEHINMNIEKTEQRLNSHVKDKFAQQDALLSERLTSGLDGLRQHISAMKSLNGDISEDKMREIAQMITTDELTSVRRDWVFEAKREALVSIANSLGELREELINIISSTKTNVTEQLALISEKAVILRADLQATQDQVTGTSNEITTMKTQLTSHESQLEILQRRQQEVLDDIAQFKISSLNRISSIEATLQDKIDAKQAVTIFNEELDKILANEDSALRLFLTENYASTGEFQELNDLVIKLENFSTIYRPGGLSITDVEDVIQISLERYSADRIEKFDFALENSGGSVILDKCSPTFPQSLSSCTLFGIPLWYVSGTANIIIQPQVYPGDCWAMNGTKGHATIRLKDAILVTGVTLEHIPKALSPNGTLDSAPRDFTVFGMSSLDDEKGTQLGKFFYNIEGSVIQQFDVSTTTSKSYEIIRFKFESNYGNPLYTCIYRVRVHGHYSR